jgi:poly-gamma-glutamate capsule biosynthesis protein CapA/YwtB (metallophosphatase superfamily)
MALSRHVLVAGLLGAVLLLAGCGGGGSSSSGGESTTEWADNVCSAITTWTKSVTSTGNELRQGSNLSADSLKNAAKDIQSSTAKLADDLQGLGAPDTDAGKDAKAAVDKLSNEIKSDADEIKSTVDNASGLSGIQAALTKASGTLAKMGSQISATFAQLQSLDAKGELEKAFEKADSCSSLVKSAG